MSQEVLVVEAHLVTRAYSGLRTAKLREHQHVDLNRNNVAPLDRVTS